MIAGLTDFAPPTLLAQASRLNFSTRLFNLIVTNVPGPQFPLYLLGREMLEIVPIAFLPENHALAIAIMSYNGKVDFGLLARLRRDARPRGVRRDAGGRAGRAAQGGAQAQQGRGQLERGQEEVSTGCPSRAQYSKPPSISLTGRPSWASRRAALQAPLQAGPQQ